MKKHLLKYKHSSKNSFTADSIINKNIFKNDDGFSSLTVVLSLLISLALIFSTAQVYRVSSESAKIQNVADAAAQAAQSQVAEFMILVRVSDSVVLSLGLGAAVCGAIGVVCMCTPVTAQASSELMKISQKLLEARQKFADKAASSLNKIQRALPFLATVKAYQVATSNNGGRLNANYVALAILQPGEGVTIEPGNIDEVKGTLDEINAGADNLRAQANEAEEQSKRAESSKYEAWKADCGNSPNYCQYERAASLAGMTGSNNPMYKSVDSWYFGYAIVRARAYFETRKAVDQPKNSSVEAYADYRLRQQYYWFANNLTRQSYYYKTGDTINMYFAHIPTSNVEMQGSDLFTKVYFPVSNLDGRPCMHAYAECPGCDSVISYDVAQNWNSSNFVTCPYCKFTQSHLGSVASASSHNPSGFEYHWKIIEEQSKIYQDAMNRCAPLKESVKNTATIWFSKLKAAMSQIVNKRIYAKPPGSYGCIAMVVNTSSAPASSGFESSFVSTDATIGVRAAVSATTMIEEKSTEGANVIASILTGLTNNMSGVSGIGSVALNVWSKLLLAYNNGSNAITNGINNGLNCFSFRSSSGLGTWASSRLKSLMSGIGFEPANLNAIKPVLINSWRVARAGSQVSPSSASGNVSKTFAVKYLSLRDSALRSQDAMNSVLSGLANAEEIKSMLDLQSVGDTNGAFEIATITPLGDWGPQIPIRVTLPKSTASAASSIVDRLTNSIRSVLGAGSGGKIWR